eukprot:1392757-Pyramimonas_sp.AAC.1
MDLNDGMGLALQDGVWRYSDTTVVDASLATKEHLKGGAGELVREIMEEFGMVLLGLREHIEPTWYGNDGSSSR